MVQTTVVRVKKQLFFFLRIRKEPLGVCEARVSYSHSWSIQHATAVRSPKTTASISSCPSSSLETRPGPPTPHSSRLVPVTRFRLDSPDLGRIRSWIAAGIPRQEYHALLYRRSKRSAVAAARLDESRRLAEPAPAYGSRAVAAGDCADFVSRAASPPASDAVGGGRRQVWGDTVAALEPAAGTIHVWARNAGGAEQWGYLQALPLAPGAQASNAAAAAAAAAAAGAAMWIIVPLHLHTCSSSSR